jgi:hypothetical protein
MTDSNGLGESRGFLLLSDLSFRFDRAKIGNELLSDPDQPRRGQRRPTLK